MKQLKILAIAALALVTLRSSSCKKSDFTPVASVGSWHVNGTPYTAKTVTKYSVDLSGMAADGVNYASVFVSGMPGSAPDAGTNYKIVGYDKMNQLADDECIVQITTSSTDMYVSTAHNGGTMNLKVNNDRISMTVPAIWATHYVSYSAQQDSVKVDASLAE